MLVCNDRMNYNLGSKHDADPAITNENIRSQYVRKANYVVSRNTTTELQFKYDAGQLQVWINGSEVGYVTLTK